MLAAVLVVGVLIFFVGQMAYHSQMIDLQNDDQITVSGQGKVYVKPDIALISLGVSAQAKTVAEATKTNTEKMNAVIEAVKALGVEAKDIQTTNYNLSPVYESYSIAVPMIYPEIGGVGKRTGTTVVGYKLEQNVQVKIRDFTKIGEILSQSTGKGANLVGSLQFTIDDPEQFRQEARAKAIAQAKDNAENLARESGINLGKIVNIYENQYGYPMYERALGMGGAADAAVPPSPSIEPGQQEINVTVNLTYRIK